MEDVDDADDSDDGVDDAYALRERVATPAEFQRLRAAAGMTERSREGVERGLPNSTYGVVVVHEASGEVVGMGRVVGDDATDPLVQRRRALGPPGQIQERLGDPVVFVDAVHHGERFRGKGPKR